MDRIRAILIGNGQRFSDAKISWPAHVSVYHGQLFQAHAQGCQPVTIELVADIPVPEDTIQIDHHGDRAHEAASVLQLCKLLGLTPTRHDLLIAANDAGYFPAMEAMGASADEMARIRALDRKAQGITEDQERAAIVALQHKIIRHGVTIVRLSHSKTATVTDRLYVSGHPQNLLIQSKDEINYFGPADICQAFQKAFPNSWFGGPGNTHGTAYCGISVNEWGVRETAFILERNGNRPALTPRMP